MIGMDVNPELEQSQSATLLFVDDEENILSSLKRLFRPVGYRILTATSGVKGLEILEKEPVDLVVSDMRMPEMDGAAFLEQAAKQWPNTIRILLTGYADMTSTIDAINKGHIYKYISKPWEDNDVKLSIRHALETKRLEKERNRLLELTQVQNEELKDLNSNLEQKVKERTEKLRKTMGLLETAHVSLKKSYVSAVKVFSSLIEIREGAVAGHSRRVAEQAKNIAQKMEMSDEEIQQVLFAGLLHDLGRIGLPDSLINKPYNALSAENRSKVAKHTVIGEGLLMALEPLHDAAKMIRSHHERYDGRGYPDGLKGGQIPLGARILAVVNDFDAYQIGTLSSKRLSLSEAREHIVRYRGKSYDPNVVDAFLELFTSLTRVVNETPGTAVKSNYLEKDMVLAKDLVTKSGVLLLSEGYILDDRLIQRIYALEESLNEDLEIYVTRRRK